MNGWVHDRMADRECRAINMTNFVEGIASTSLTEEVFDCILSETIDCFVERISLGEAFRSSKSEKCRGCEDESFHGLVLFESVFVGEELRDQQRHLVCQLTKPAISAIFERECVIASMKAPSG